MEFLGALGNGYKERVSSRSFELSSSSIINQSSGSTKTISLLKILFTMHSFNLILPLVFLAGPSLAAVRLPYPLFISFFLLILYRINAPMAAIPKSSSVPKASAAPASSTSTARTAPTAVSAAHTHPVSRFAAPRGP
jgi:hypothetical protein